MSLVCLKFIETFKLFENLTFKALAAFVYSGTRFLQCPHQGAKNSTTQTSSPLTTNLSKLSGVNSITFPLLGYIATQFVANIVKTVTKINIHMVLKSIGIY